MPSKKQKFGEAKSPFEMKGSPHKLGTIEGTSMHKASIAKAVEQTRTAGDMAIVGAASELGSSYVPHEMDYSIKTGFIAERKKSGGGGDDDNGDNMPTEKMPRKGLKKLKVPKITWPKLFKSKKRGKVGSVADWTPEDYKFMHGGGTKILKD